MFFQWKPWKNPKKTTLGGFFRGGFFRAGFFTANPASNREHSNIQRVKIWIYKQSRVYEWYDFIILTLIWILIGKAKILIFIKLPRMTKNEVNVVTMVIVWNGNSEIGAHLWNDLGNLICSRHLFRPRAVTTLIFFSSEKNNFPSYLRNTFWVTIQFKYTMIMTQSITYFYI